MFSASNSAPAGTPNSRHAIKKLYILLTCQEQAEQADRAIERGEVYSHLPYWIHLSLSLSSYVPVGSWMSQCLACLDFPQFVCSP